MLKLLNLSGRHEYFCTRNLQWLQRTESELKCPLSGPMIPLLDNLSSDVDQLGKMPSPSISHWKKKRNSFPISK